MRSIYAFRYLFKRSRLPHRCTNITERSKAVCRFIADSQDQVNSAPEVSLFTSGAERTDREKSAKLIAKNLSSARTIGASISKLALRLISV